LADHKRLQLRLLIIAPSLDILGGQAVQAERLTSRLRENPTLEVGFLPVNPRLPGIFRKLQSVKYLRTIVTSILYFSSLLRNVRKYDVIHVFSASYFSFLLAPAPAIIVTKLYRKKALLNYHSGEAADHLARWRRSALPIIKLADVVVVPSEYLVRVFADFGIRANAIFNIVDMREFPFRERNPLRPIFLSNRNLESHYGVDCVLRAFAIIQQCRPDATLTVVGDGSQRKSLEKLKNELHLNETTFTGRVPPQKIQQYYSAADIFLNGSEIDNQPLSILEAFAGGLPVVTTDAGGIPDIVTDGRTGFIVRRGDHKAMAERAISLLNDPQMASQTARDAFLECRHYGWEAVCEAWLEQYRQLCGEGAKDTAFTRSFFV
jgi:glycosyltransferase involved in cell wall biosynthesis